jgi:Glutathione peroxidase
VEVLSIRHVNDRDFPCTTSRALRWGNYNPINIHPLGEELLPFPGRSIASILTLFSSRYRSAKFHVKFPMMAKVSVKGDDKTPLYQYLTAAPNVSGEITWNFTKFLLRPNRQRAKSAALALLNYLHLEWCRNFQFSRLNFHDIEQNFHSKKKSTPDHP